jgi:Transcriptional regulatory protein, C terminal
MAVETRLTRGRPGPGAFVGRREELLRLRRLIVDPAPRVLFVHGLAGSGKSTLLRRFAADFSSGDPLVVVVDGREIEPTEQGFAAAVARATGSGSLDELPGRVVLCVDHYEMLRLLDTWLRQALTPSLPTNVSMLVAGREEPNQAWTRLPAGAFEAMLLGPLRPEESTELVRAMGVPAEDVVAITRFAGGHPLTLVLGALAAKERSPYPTRDVTLSRLLDEFTRAYLDDLDDRTERVLEAAAVVRRLSRPLLEAMLPDLDASEGLQSLRELPFVDVAADGLTLHEALQQTIATQLRALEPSRYLGLRRRAWAHLRHQLRTAPRSELWRQTADMIYLVENPAVREAHFPSGAHNFAVETATPADAGVIDAIIERHEPPPAAELLRVWWSRCPEAFRVARDARGDVVGFSIITTSGRTDPRRFAYDPVVAMWLDHLAQHPTAPGQEVLLIRRWLTWDAGDGPCEAQASMWLDLKRSYMELRPRLRRNYGVTDHPEVYGPVMEQIDGGVIPGGAVEIGDRDYHGLYLEFGPSSVDGWLTRLAAAEFGVPEDDLLDARLRQLLVDGRRVDLTPKEFEVMHLLRERTGQTVPRAELLAAVWGYKDDLGSNVVDAVIYRLREKLGDKADLIQTVRGVGYRLSP